MVNKTQVQICLSVFFLAVSIAFVIIGALLPGQIIQPLINSGVKSAIPINANNFNPAYDMTVGSGWNKFVNVSLNSNFHVFNITNLRDVLINGALPNYQDVQINIMQYQFKFNVTYNADQTLVTYYQASFYVIQDQASQDLLSKNVISVNPLYLAGAQQAEYQINFLQEISTGSFIPPSSYAPNYTDFFVSGAYLNGVLTNIQTQISNPTSTLQQGFHVLSIPAYFQAVSGLAAAFHLPNASTPVLHWSKLDFAATWASDLTSASLPTYAPLAQGFELPAAITNPALLPLIWTPTQAGSIPYSLQSWVNALTANAGDRATIFIALNTGLQGTLNTADFQTILQWIGLLLTPSAQLGYFENYEAAVAFGVRAKLQAGKVPYIPATSADINTLQTFPLLGYYQFATGAVTSVLLGQTVPTGTIDVLGVQGGLGAAVGNAEPLEIATACYMVNKQYYQTNGIATFSINDAMNILDGLTGAYAVSLGLPSSAQQLFSIAFLNVMQKALPKFQANRDAFVQVSSGHPWDYYVSTYVVPTVQNQPQLVPLEPLIVASLNLFTFMNNQSQSQCFFDWYVVYLANEFTGVVPGVHAYENNSPYKIGADGVAPQNSGLFFRVPIRQVLTGVPSTATRLGLSIPGILCDPFELLDYGTNPWDSTVLNTIFSKTYVRDLGRQFIKYTGVDDYRKTGLLYQTYGTRSFQGACQVKDPAHTSTSWCANVTSGVPNTIFNNYTVWNTVENLDLVSDAYEWPALQGNQQTLMAWVSNVARVVPFQYQGGVTVKDISTNQYYVDPSVIMLNAATPNVWKSSTWNDQFSPDGTIDITSLENAPVVVSWPHFYGADGRFASIMTGLNPQYALHHSEVDVDPLTGLTIQAFKRLQANFKVSSANLQWNTHYTNLLSSSTTFQVSGDAHPYTYIPYYWGDQNNVITDDDNHKYYNSIILPMKVANILQIILPIVGGIGMIVFSVTLYRSCSPNRETSKKRYGDV